MRHPNQHLFLFLFLFSPLISILFFLFNRQIEFSQSIGGRGSGFCDLKYCVRPKNFDFDILSISVVCFTILNDIEKVPVHSDRDEFELGV